MEEYVKHSILILTSLYEPFGLVLPEAMSCGLPVVAFDCDGAREVCINDQTGFLVPMRDREKLTQALITLVRDPGLRKQLGAQGRDYVTPRFSEQTMVQQTYELYQKLLV